MTTWMRPVAACFMLSASFFANADILTDWQRQYHVNANEESFADVAIDDAGNVYAIGKSYNGSNFDAIIVKYGAGGTVHWAVKYGGLGDQIGESLSIKPDGSELYVAFVSKPGRVWFHRLNPASGASVWGYQFNAPPTKIYDWAHVLYDPAANLIHLGIWGGQVGVNAALYNYTYNTAGGIVTSSGLGLSPGDRFLDAAVRPQGGVYYLIGDPTTNPPASSIYGFQQSGTYTGSIWMNYATAIGSSSAKGGTLIAAGRYASDKIIVHRIDTATNSIVTGQPDTFTGLTDVRVLGASAGPNGEAYVVGSEAVSGKGTEWFLARYSFQTVAREWRTARPNTANNEFYRDCAADPFGNVGVLGVRAGATDQLFTKVYDGTTGTLLGQSSTNAPSGASNLFSIAANSGGIFASAGVVQDAGFTAGLLTKVSQDGIKKVTTPLVNYTGGASIACTVSMYASKGVSRTVTLASNSPFAPVPANTIVAANTVNKSFNIASLPTGVDRTIVISASWQGVTRQATFYLRAPRPNNLEINPSGVIGGLPSTGTVTMTGLSPAGGVNVNLSSDGTEATVPATVNVPQGSNQKQFQISTTSVAVITGRTISASANGVTKTAMILVYP